MINPWKILGVHRKQSDAEIRDAYYTIARRNHPDVQKYDHGTELADYGSEEFIQAVQAYKAIGTAKARTIFLKQFPGKDCSKCSGAGTVSKTKGLTKREYTACKGCGGAGVIIREKEDEPVIVRGTNGAGSKRRYKKR